MRELAFKIGFAFGENLGNRHEPKGSTKSPDTLPLVVGKCISSLTATWRDSRSLLWYSTTSEAYVIMGTQML